MNTIDNQNKITRIKTEASRLMHLHYCQNDVDSVIATFGSVMSWFGAGEDQYAVGRDEVTSYFRRFRGAIAKCTISDEEYDVMEAAPDLFVCTGRMWIATDPSSEMYLKVHQRVTFVYRWDPDMPQCLHIHCSNPYMELVGDEQFPDRIGRQSYEYVQESLRRLKEEMAQKNRQMEIVMSSISGGLAICKADEPYTYLYVSREAAALFGYTPEEFVEASGGTGTGAIYPPDRQTAIQGFRNDLSGGKCDYAQKYRIQCKDGSLKWVLDSGKISRNEQGDLVLNALYLDITRAEKDAEEMRMQQELLSSIYNTVPCGIIRLLRKDGSYQVISLNPAAFTLLGLRPQDGTGRHWPDGIADTVLTEDRHILSDSYQCLKNLGDREWIEYRVRWQDGTIHCLKGSNSLVAVTEDSQVIQRMFIDVTESRQLEEQLELEREMYRLAMESSSDVMYEYTMETDTLTAYEPDTDAEGGSTVSRNVFPEYRALLNSRNIVHPDDIQKVLDNICGGRCEPFDCRFRTPSVPESDSYWWFRVTGRLISHEGLPCRVVGTIHNIQREKQEINANLRELQMSQAALQAINSSYLGIYYVDLDEDWSYGIRLPGMGETAIYERQLQFTREMRTYITEHVAKTYQEQLYNLTDPNSLQQLLSASNGRTAVEYWETRREPGQWLRMDVYQVSCDQQKLHKLVLSFRNVTEERQRELNRKREEEKAKQALQEAYETARRANLAKSDFLSRMSHDIRTPMHAVIGMTTIAENSLSDPEKLRDCLDKIRISSNHLLQLINEVLDMSKIESGNTQLHSEPFSIRNTLTVIREMIEPEILEKDQAFTLKIRRLKHDGVTGDEGRVQQILLNLLSNAVKYTPPQGHIFLTANELLSSDSGTSCYQFTVEDDGIGMSEDFIEKLFLPFERANDARVNAIHGTGLGLSIAQNLTRMMNGTIEVTSRLNHGSCFTVTLYLKLTDHPVIQECTQEPSGNSLSFQGLRHILLVDDNSLNREIARELLEMEHMLVEEASDGREALELFRNSPVGYYDLVLMDIQMPEMDGYTASRSIRKQDRPDASTIPIIALTANAFADDILAARQAGMDMHMAKPFDIGQLKEVLARWLPK